MLQETKLLSASKKLAESVQLLYTRSRNPVNRGSLFILQLSSALIDTALKLLASVESRTTTLLF